MVILVKESLCLYLIKSRFQTSNCLIEFYGTVIYIYSTNLHTTESSIFFGIAISYCYSILYCS